MLGVKENMLWKFFFVFISLVFGIYCENWLNNDQIENHQVMFEHRKFNGYYRQHVKSGVGTSSLRRNQFAADEPSVPFDGGDRKTVRRTNLRRRKMGSRNSSNKKYIFRRGQRHRQNKNGNSFFKTTNQSVFLLSPFFSLGRSLHNQRNNKPFLISVMRVK